MWAARHFRPYLLGHHTTVFTDHSICVSALTTARPSGKLARWALTLQELNLTLKHRAGKLNTNADALSRIPSSNTTGSHNNHAIPIQGSGVDICESVTRIDHITRVTLNLPVLEIPDN